MIFKILLVFCLSLISLIKCDYDIESFSFLTSCNDISGVKYDSNSPIEIINNQFQWKNSSNLDSCKFLINVVPNSIVENKSESDISSFIIRFKPTDLVKCSDSVSLTVESPSTSAINSSNNVLVTANLCDLLETNKYITINVTSSSFSIILNSTKSINSSYPFQILESIVITSFNYANSSTNKCKSNQFNCVKPSNICLDEKFKCDLYESCPDGSDQFNCSNITPSSSSSSSIITTTRKITNSTMNSTVYYVTLIAITPDSREKSSSLNFFIGIIIFLVILTGILTGVWLYGRRKRRWRELLAQLDNNTDWEYEQLEDGPSMVSSRSTVTPSLNRNISNDDRETNLSTINRQSSNTNNNAKLNERSRIHFN